MVRVTNLLNSLELGVSASLLGLVFAMVGQWKSACSGVPSGKLQSWQAAVLRLCVNFRYCPKEPCPVNICVVQYVVGNVCVPTFGVSTFVHCPFVERSSHSFCHS